MSDASRPHRGTIHVENAEIIDHKAFAGDQYIMRLHAPQTALHAKAGSFIHVQCDPQRLMRRPMSLLHADKATGFIDMLYKVHGEGTRLLANRRPGEHLSLMGPIGQTFKQQGYRKTPLLIGGGVGIPPMIFLAEHLRDQAKDTNPFMIMGSEVPFPFEPKPSSIIIPGMPDGVIASMPMLENWGIPSRLASLQNYPGCFDGYVTDLARSWLDEQTAEEQQHVEIFACGPTPMLKAVQTLAADYGLPCQLSLEEYMACAVGGCAGCAVRIETDEGPAMKRVCVDGPIFEAETIHFQ